MRIPALIEKVLPLLYHALELVVEDENLDTDIELGGGGELHGSISVDVDDDFVRLCNLAPMAAGRPKPMV